MNWKTIVVGIDETEASDRALERAAELAQAPGVELVVTSAAAVLTGMAAAHGVGPWDPADSPEEHREELAHAREYLEGRNVTAEFVLGAGEPSEAILDVAEEHERRPDRGRARASRSGSSACSAAASAGPSARRLTPTS